MEKLIIKTAKRIPVKFSGKPKLHSTAGYRLGVGAIEAYEPIVALSILKVGNHVVWTRSSHRTGNSLEVEILFSPISMGEHDIQVAYCIADACTYGGTVINTAMTPPAPNIKDLVTGEIVDVGIIHGSPVCELKALLMVRSDVKSVRNGIWHARVEHIASLDDPWKKMLSYGRTGEADLHNQRPPADPSADGPATSFTGSCIIKRIFF
jgi:hypothetical protein